MKTPTQFRIEPATVRDLPIILHMIRALAEYEKLSHEVVATEARLRDAIFGARPFAEVVIGYAGDEPAGFAVFFHTFSTFVGVPGLYLEDLFVESRFRGRGFGKKLLAFVAHQAVTRGCQRFEWCALDWNEPALRFYRSLGARQRGEWIVHQLTGEELIRLANEAIGS
jgi:GNAT superfamily N-acetyltransferase